jgi:electron transfer flavoprotein alpha subunit
MSGILIMAEHINGVMRDITGELIGAGVLLKEKFGGSVTVAVLGEGNAELMAAANLAGVDEVIDVNVGVTHFDAAVYEETAALIGEKCRPRTILVGHTVSGMAYAPALAARLGSGFASDVYGLDEVGGELTTTRGAYGNKVNLETVFPGKGVVVMTIRGATFMAPEDTGIATTESLEFDFADLARRCVHIDYSEPPEAGVDLSKAEFILSVGRGIQDEENIARFMELAEKLGAVFGCSRPIVDAGWLPKSHQVGQSGKVASSCTVYLALGISGAVQHQFGMKHVETIIAINTDPKAPIFNVATYGASIDVFEFADALERQLN